MVQRELSVRVGAAGALTNSARCRQNPLADEETFAVIYPDGIPSPRSHNGGSCCSPANSRTDPTDDVGCAAAWAAQVASLLETRGLSLDRSRIYAYGMSNGGFMALRLGCQSASLFAAVATVTGVLGNESPTTDDFACDLESTGGLPIPMLHIHGTDDGTVGYERVARGIEAYRALNRCTDTGPPTQTYSRVRPSSVVAPHHPAAPRLLPWCLCRGRQRASRTAPRRSLMSRSARSRTAGTTGLARRSAASCPATLSAAAISTARARPGRSSPATQERRTLSAPSVSSAWYVM